MGTLILTTISIVAAVISIIFALLATRNAKEATRAANEAIKLAEAIRNLELEPKQRQPLLRRGYRAGETK